MNQLFPEKSKETEEKSEGREELLAEITRQRLPDKRPMFAENTQNTRERKSMKTRN